MIHTPDFASRSPIDSFPAHVQDLGDVLYDLPVQGERERYIDYAQRIVDGLAAEGWIIVPADPTSENK